MHTTNLFRNFALVVIIAGFTAVLTSFAAPPAPTERNADKVRSDLNRLRDIGPQGGRLSTSERDELERIKDHLRSSDPNEVVSGIAEGIRSGKLNREVPAYRQILPELPAVKQEVLRRIAAESDPVVKGGLINCVLRVPGADVIRTLIHQLDDKRPAIANPGPSALRVCDKAYNVIYDRVAHIQELGFDYSSAMSDTISPGVPVEWRDSRVTKLKAALVAKFGPELKLPDGI